MQNQNSIQLTSKQILILFFIETEFADTDYKLVKHLDRSAFFPARLSENLPFLIKNHLIESSEYSNGFPFKYIITEKGISYLDQNLQNTDLIDFANHYSNKDFIMQIIPILLRKQINDGKIQWSENFGN